MKLNRCLALVITFFLFACQPPPLPTVTILDNDKIITLQTDERVPSALITQAGITLAPNDRVLSNGLPIQPELPIIAKHPLGTNYPITLQLRRAVNLTLVTPDGQRQIQSSAFTVGEVLQEAGIQVRTGDLLDPPADTPITQLPITIYYSPAHPLTVSVDGMVVQIQSSAKTIGEALAEAGIPLLGLDQAIPSEREALPVDAQIKVVRVSESVVLAQKPIPFESELVASADIPLDQNQILQPGESGLSVQRIRIRYEDGNEVSRVTENETMVRPPKNRVLGYGTQIEIKTATVDGVQIEYWRAMQMFATSYSPCRLGVPGLCSTTTASGLPAKKGVAGMKLVWYNAMAGQQFYIPGYGFAVLGDSGGSYPDGRPHIDLAYSDEDFVGWHQWVIVYFLTPVPNSIIYILQ